MCVCVCVQALYLLAASRIVQLYKQEAEYTEAHTHTSTHTHTHTHSPTHSLSDIFSKRRRQSHAHGRAHRQTTVSVGVDQGARRLGPLPHGGTQWGAVEGAAGVDQGARRLNRLKNTCQGRIPAM